MLMCFGELNWEATRLIILLLLLGLLVDPITAMLVLLLQEKRLNNHIFEVTFYLACLSTIFVWYWKAFTKLFHSSPKLFFKNITVTNEWRLTKQRSFRYILL